VWMTLLCGFQRAIPSFSALEPLIFALCSPLFASNQVDRTVSVVHTSWQLLVLRRSWGELKVGALLFELSFRALTERNSGGGGSAPFCARSLREIVGERQ
jgi:hypothetical protein